jgi:glycosyltransferase involved in cell wall biosynthesis
MLSEPRVSVIIPTYNCGRFLPATLESVFGQSFKDFEIIVIDDGSTDDTEKVVEPYRDHIIYLSGTNKGAAAARNIGLKIARGDLITFLDADDMWESEKLTAQVLLMDSHLEIRVSYTNFTFFGASSSITRTGFEERDGALLRYEREKIGELQYMLTSKSLLYDYLVVQAYPKPSMLMVRRHCFEKVGVFDESLSICEDTQMCLRLAKHFNFGYVDRCLVKRRVRTDTLSSAADDRRYAAVHIQMFENLERWIPLSKIERRAVNRALANYRLAAGYVDFSEYRLASSRKHLWSSVKVCWTIKSLFYLSLTILPVNLLKAARCVRQWLRGGTSGPVFPC